MKKTPNAESNPPGSDDMLPEYRFDYTKAKPNRFAKSASSKQLSVVLDDDVAEVFSTPESVNKALRAIIEAFPRTAGHGTK